jgi:proliferating cell nuclear antigen PCNA
MKIVINDSYQKSNIVALFHLLKSCTSCVCTMFKHDHLHIQGMDKSHVCLFDIKIYKKWFSEYDCKDETICFDTHTFYNIINSAGETHSIGLSSTNDGDNLDIDLITSQGGLFNKHFRIPLIDMEYDVLEIPETEYDAEFSIHSKKICDIVSQMTSFGSDLNIKCSEESFELIANGIIGEMSVKIPIDDLTAFSINEGEVINLKYSLSYINKMCLTNKLSTEIDFFISRDCPMKIKYDLGEESSFAFYIAPKISDD